VTDARRRVAAALAAGLVSAAGFAPLDFWPLTIAGVAALIWLLGRTPTLKSALATGWWWGLGHFAASLYWIAHAFQFQAKMPSWLGWVAVVALSGLMAIYPAAAAGIGWRFGQRGLAARLLGFAGAWMLAEYLRGFIFGGFPWNPLGVVLLPVPGLPHVAAAIGGLGLSGVVVMIAGAVLLAAEGQRRAAAGAAAGVLALAAGGAIWAATPPPAGKPVPLVVVQANIGQGEKWDPLVEEANLRKHLTLTAGALRQTPPGALVAWPEAAVTGLLDEDPILQLRVGAVLRDGDLLLTGADKALRDRDGWAYAAHNSLFVVSPRGRLLARYDKARLVPYGEYLPLRWLFEPLGIARLVPGGIDFWPGPGPRTLALPGFPAVGPQICYEIVASGLVVDRDQRPKWILNASNDAWFSDGGAWMHLAQARLRAIEEGIPVVRATPTGVSAIIDSHGRVVDKLERNRAGVLRGELPQAAFTTIFGKAGQILPLIMAIVCFPLAGAVTRR
jgi:apolipoprotein N-acyltransferase